MSPSGTPDTGDDTDNGQKALCTGSPAVPLVVALALGAVTGLAAAGILPRLALLLSAPGSVTLLAGRRRFPDCARALPWVTVGGTALTLLHLWAPWDTVHRHRSRHVCGVEARLTVTAPSYAGTEQPSLSHTYSTPARFRAIRTRAGDGWQRCRGKVLVRFDAPQRLPYGSALTVAGALAPLDSVRGGARGAYGRYLRGRGIRHVLHVSGPVVCQPAGGWRRLPALLYRWRDALADALVRDMPPGPETAIVLAMVLGYRRGLDPDLQRQFLHSGAIHVFAISGLHVGIAAALMSWIARLCRVPLRSRCWGLPLALGFYVLLTGAAPSSLRAWLMITIWSVARATLRPAPVQNSVAASALVLLLANPLYLTQRGFLFSYVIVGVLIAGWPHVSHLCAAANERNHWLPPQRRAGRIRAFCRRRPLQMVGASLLAWLGSAGLTAWSNGLLLPAAILTNIVVSALAAGVLTVGFPKAIATACGLPWVSVVLGRLLWAVAALLRVTAVIGSRSTCNSVVAAVSGMGLLPYYAALAVLLAPRVPGRVRALAATALALWLIALTITIRPQPPGLLVCHGGDGPLPAVVLLGGHGGPVVLQAGSRGAGDALAEELRRRGHATVEWLLIADGRWESGSGALSIVEALQPRCLVATPRLRQDSPRRELVETFRETGGSCAVLQGSDRNAPWVYSSGALRVTVLRRDGHVTITCTQAAPNSTIQATVVSQPTGTTRLTVSSSDGHSHSTTLQPKREPAVLVVTAAGVSTTHPADGLPPFLAESTFEP